jgi:hypothetical protein
MPNTWLGWYFTPRTQRFSRGPDSYRGRVKPFKGYLQLCECRLSIFLY